MVERFFKDKGMILNLEYFDLKGLGKADVNARTFWSDVTVRF